MINRTVRRAALGATVTAALFTGLASTAQADTCVQISDTFPKLAPTGDLQVKEVCTVVNTLRPPNPSTTSGRGYWLDDGTVLWLSDAEWWELMDKAVADEAWQDANHDLLTAVGILECHLEVVSTITRIDITKQYQFCPPTWDPYERPRYAARERNSIARTTYSQHERHWSRSSDLHYKSAGGMDSTMLPMWVFARKARWAATI